MNTKVITLWQLIGTMLLVTAAYVVAIWQDHSYQRKIINALHDKLNKEREDYEWKISTQNYRLMEFRRKYDPNWQKFEDAMHNFKVSAKDPEATKEDKLFWVDLAKKSLDDLERDEPKVEFYKAKDK